MKGEKEKYHLSNSCSTVVREEKNETKVQRKLPKIRCSGGQFSATLVGTQTNPIHNGLMLFFSSARMNE